MPVEIEAAEIIGATGYRDRQIINLAIASRDLVLASLGDLIRMPGRQVTVFAIGNGLRTVGFVRRRDDHRAARLTRTDLLGERQRASHRFGNAGLGLAPRAFDVGVRRDVEDRMQRAIEQLRDDGRVADIAANDGDAPVEAGECKLRFGMVVPDQSNHVRSMTKKSPDGPAAKKTRCAGDDGSFAGPEARVVG